MSIETAIGSTRHDVAGSPDPGNSSGADHARVALATRSIRAVVFLLAGTLSVAFFFRYQIINHFSILLSDRLDGVIETTILEHWFNVLRGLAPYNKTRYFFPSPDTLGYNDGYFIYGCIYSMFRAGGINPFLASELVNVCLCCLGFCSFAWCVQLVYKTELFFTIFSSILFISCSNVFIQVVHTQILGVFFAPLLTSLIYLCIAAAIEGNRRSTISYGMAAAVLHVSWLLTTFYMAWFYVFFICCVVLVAVVRFWSDLSVAEDVIRRNTTALVIILVTYALALIPFVNVYLPKAMETGQHSYDGVSIYLPTLIDVVNVGPDNLLFGRAYSMLSELFRPGFPAYGESATGFPPVLIFLFAAAALWSVRRAPDDGARGGKRGAASIARGLALVAGLGTLVSWICVIKVGDQSLWALVYDVVPGAKTVRVVSRYQVFLCFPVVLLVAFYMQARYASLARSALTVICALLLLEQVELVSNVHLNLSEELALLSSVPKPPARCRSFYVSHSREDVADPGEVMGIYSHNVDAMLIAEVLNLPTINGFATFTPPRWTLVQPQQERYMDDVRTYIASHALNGVCGLDLHTMTWETGTFS